METAAAAALASALDLFLAHPEIGFVWLAFAPTAGAPTAVGACVVCHAISTSRGTLVAKLDDVTIRDGWQGRGVGSAMLGALGAHLLGATSRASTRRAIATTPARGASTSGSDLRPLDEERIALLSAVSAAHG